MKSTCDACNKSFSDKYVMNRHRRDYCKVLKQVHNSESQNTKELQKVSTASNLLSDNDDGNRSEFKAVMQMLLRHEAMFNEQKAKTSSLELVVRNTKRETDSEIEKATKTQDSADKPNGDSKIDIVCLAKGDYIKKLIELHDGDEEKAMNYIKNVGIARDFLEGDFRMIKKVYFDGKKKSQFPIRVKDFKRNKLEYLEENGEWILDIRGEIVGKRLCENIVNTLLIANTQFNEIIINEPDEDRKELFLDLFQINKTQAHIMKLLERKTQGKLSRRVAEFINYCTEVHAETGSLESVKKAYE